jgi:hypothetical protein
MRHGESGGTDIGAGRTATAYLAELQCFLCGSLAGSIETDRKPLPPYGIWHPAGGARPTRVADWRQLRCNRCGGALFAESIDTIAKSDTDDELRREVPRRGRPPKWLVEERRRAREAAESRFG